MIELKRLKLINWHNFENTTFDCARLTYMIGVNAVGTPSWALPKNTMCGWRCMYWPPA